MPATFDTFAQSLQRLLKKFDADKDNHLSKGYSEAQVRIDFITPFFKALGWDVEDEAGLPHHEREVVVERGEAETEGRPDYSFRVGGQTKFFVEAKAPSEPLDTAKHILQAKGYAWNTRPDIYDQGTLFGDAERERINAFDWNGGPAVGPLSPPATKEAAVGEHLHGAPATREREGRKGPPLRTATGPITVPDEEIDNLVYELYGIKEEERKIIEGSL